MLQRVPEEAFGALSSSETLRSEFRHPYFGSKTLGLGSKTRVRQVLHCAQAMLPPSIPIEDVRKALDQEVVASGCCLLHVYDRAMDSSTMSQGDERPKLTCPGSEHLPGDRRGPVHRVPCQNSFRKQRDLSVCERVQSHKATNSC